MTVVAFFVGDAGRPFLFSAAFTGVDKRENSILVLGLLHYSNQRSGIVGFMVDLVFFMGIENSILVLVGVSLRVLSTCAGVG